MLIVICGAIAALTDGLLGDGAAVVVEGDFLTTEERTEFRDALRTGELPLYVTLRVPVETALARVSLDPTRGLSRDPAFLTRHYAELAEQIQRRPSSDLVIDTSSETADASAGAIVDWASRPAMR